MNYFQLSKAEWAKQRWGKFTGSGISRLMGKGFDTYVEEVACERYCEYEDSGFEGTWEMREGKRKEPEAFRFHEKILKSFAVVPEVGEKFHPFQNGMFTLEYYGDNKPFFKEFEDPKYKGYCGVSPDSVAFRKNGDPYLLGEYKCPKRSTHMFYIKNIREGVDLKLHEPGYYGQIQFNLLVWGAELAHFCSYNEYFPQDQKMHLVEVLPDKNYLMSLKTRLSNGIKKVNSIIEELKSL